MTSSWTTDEDLSKGTYENIRVKDGSLDIGLYPEDPYFNSEWGFTVGDPDDDMCNDDDDNLTTVYSYSKTTGPFDNAYFYGRRVDEESEGTAYAVGNFYLGNEGIKDNLILHL